MTQELLSIGPTENIDALVEHCVQQGAFPDDAFVLVERLPSKVVKTRQERQELLRFARLRAKIKLAPYTSGRVFTETFELRWEQDAGTTRVVYLGQPCQLPGLEKQATFDLKSKRRYYLFGTLLGTDDLEAMELEAMPLEADKEDTVYYAEVRIPRLLPYPIAPRPIEKTPKQRVQLVVGEYHHDTLGQLFRFQAVEPCK